MSCYDPDSPCRTNIYRISEEAGRDVRKLRDFSSSINPLGLSKKVKAVLRKRLKQAHYYPDPDASKLRRVISRNYGINSESIIVGNGTTQLIHAIVRTINPSSVLIVSPACHEYERAVLINDGIHRNCRGPAFIDYLILNEEENFALDNELLIRKIRDNRYNILFINNPNSITGQKIDKSSMLEVVKYCTEKECFLILDESFVEFCCDISLINEVSSSPFLIVLRSFSFLYGLAGLRVGYGVVHESFVDKVKKNTEPWSVNALAQEAAAAYIKDKKYIPGVLKFFNEEKIAFEKFLRKAGFDFIPSYTNSYLIRIKDAKETAIRLFQKGILVDDCSAYRGLKNKYIRVSLLKRRENKIFIRTLTETIASLP